MLFLWFPQWITALDLSKTSGFYLTKGVGRVRKGPDDTLEKICSVVSIVCDPPIAHQKKIGL